MKKDKSGRYCMEGEIVTTRSFRHTLPLIYGQSLNCKNSDNVYQLCFSGSFECDFYESYVEDREKTHEEENRTHVLMRCRGIPNSVRFIRE